MTEKLYWTCACGRQTPLNSEHPQAKTVWVPGFKLKMFCWTCMKTLAHVVAKEAK